VPLLLIGNWAAKVVMCVGGHACRQRLIVPVRCFATGGRVRGVLVYLACCDTMNEEALLQPAPCLRPFSCRPVAAISLLRTTSLLAPCLFRPSPKEARGCALIFTCTTHEPCSAVASQPMYLFLPARQVMFEASADRRANHVGHNFFSVFLLRSPLGSHYGGWPSLQVMHANACEDD
jgi:hypothetical protein